MLTFYELTRLTRKSLERDLEALADPEKAANLSWFFKTGKGQYGEGDRFLGIKVPEMRRTALRYRGLALSDIERLLKSRYHEIRLAALEILVAKYEKESPKEQEEIARFYLDHTEGINNWDLVDASAPYILGDYLKSRSRDLLDRLAVSPNLWERRIAIVSTLGLIKKGEIEDTFRIAEKLLSDKHDLIHKAVGWALREAGKVSRPAMLQFLRQHYKAIPRTALRYAIEHLPPDQRKCILSGQLIS